ncbi:hypothetical protein P4H70_15130 [Paenibacillus ehimensis]|uniref:hypothetical protein n=1 Tax=Paenibacillus ehimensis TaxID=79264 RepID=UPI002DBE9E7D|nr:hypothetical protein [Paenibacillus ehimensis]MEC0210270.1 hypothetical protein [Paenibacillus ehimensis]
MRVTRLRARLGADFAPGRTRGRPGIYVIMVSRSGDAPTGDPLGLIDGADSQRLNRQGTGSACTGASNKEIGGRLCTSLATVKTYIINSYPKPGCPDGSRHGESAAAGASLAEKVKDSYRRMPDMSLYL